MSPSRIGRAGAAALVEAWHGAHPAFASANGDAPFIAALREQALASLMDLGLPHRKLEEWRYTSLAVIEGRDWTPMGPSDADSLIEEDVRAAIASLRLPDSAAARAVFVDGRLESTLSDLYQDQDQGQDHAGLELHSFATARRGGEGEELLRTQLGQLAEHKTEAFTALNTAFCEDGAVIEIAANAQLASPIHLVFVSTGRGRLVCPRVVVAMQAGSRATIVQSFVSTGDVATFTNAVVELSIGTRAGLDWITLQCEGDASIHVSNTQIHQARDSRLATHTFTLGGLLVRNQLDVLLGDTGAEADLRGLFLAAGDRLADNHTLVDHAMPHCTSRELYKGILGDSARGVFRGRVLVRRDAQKTDASQSNRNLLLSDRAEIDTKPQLEIYADDVKCSHGSTIGQLDADALFYLRSRGLSEAAARIVLMRGFANDICDALPGEDLMALGRSLVATALQRVVGQGGA